jgi:hypothetical protein
MHLELIYRARYNGWDIVDENGAEVENDDLIDDLSEFTYDLCDDDGYFGRDEFSIVELNEIMTMVNCYFENPEIKITMDFISS